MTAAQKRACETDQQAAERTLGRMLNRAIRSMMEGSYRGHPRIETVVTRERVKFVVRIDPMRVEDIDYCLRARKPAKKKGKAKR